ncbi:MAG: hypothetical protein A3D31_07445 [Candidatus Fluviicola riflensis]|nr:MAG: hypothetical protein CHH17_07565 [Candidatus Fluviicola riflensis]OGS79781.1 MAG: hypothetical protein A3D31_07445 [Candidatus Fluviicola riflensis]OGS87214.1 MAG: hypothetical protein A2724_06905 [Fluviicola sp. RIFCSPHIGHO2_01_FULL_43_53]OGS90002.1 MAG: hypothetical protein A3E30_03650 [Fluviicola sp. RIFCSPHIGHO2_12_FULL_43_24]
MKRFTSAIYVSIATLVLFSCEKEQTHQNTVAKNLKTKVYVLHGQEYLVTYSENAKTGECVLEKSSAANQTIGEFIANHEQAVIIDQGTTGKCFLFEDMAEFDQNRSTFFKKHHGISDQEKTSNNLVRATFYEHANYVNPLAPLTSTTSTVASTVTDPALSSRIQTFVGVNWATSKVFWNSWVGASFNDRVSSIYAEKVTGTVKLQPWNHFVIAIYEDLNYGGDVYFFVRNDAEIPTGHPNLQLVSMWGGFNNFNDETSSFWGSAFVY